MTAAFSCSSRPICFLRRLTVEEFLVLHVEMLCALMALDQLVLHRGIFLLKPGNACLLLLGGQLVPSNFLLQGMHLVGEGTLQYSHAKLQLLFVIERQRPIAIGIHGVGCQGTPTPI